MYTFTHHACRCFTRRGRIGGYVNGLLNHTLTARHHRVLGSPSVLSSCLWQRRDVQISSHGVCDDFVCVDDDFAPAQHRVGERHHRGAAEHTPEVTVTAVRQEPAHTHECEDDCLDGPNDGVRRSRLGIIQRETTHDPSQMRPCDDKQRIESRRVGHNECREASVSSTALSTSVPDTSEAVSNPSPHATSHDAQQSTPTAMTPSSSAQQAKQLPYDDDKFAETLLQMQVDGAIDEAWQDRPQACFSDVAEIVGVLTSMKVRDVCCINVSAKTCNFDYIVMGTCEGARHIHLAAWAAQEADTLHRISKVSRKHTDEQWEVVTIGRILVNLMVESLRDELSLERKWAVTVNMDALQAANAAVSEGRQVKSHGLWTLTLNLQDLEDFEVDYCKDVLLKQF